MPNLVKCVYELCDVTNLTGGAKGYCSAHYQQVRLGKNLTPAKGSRYYWIAKLNDKEEKQCSRCEYWLPLEEFHDRRDGSRVNTEFGRAHCRRCNILRRMGLTARDYDAILASQGGRCAICRIDQESAGGRTFCVDHDHSHCSGAGSCGRCVRGLVCNSCNSLLGYARDNRDILAAASDYLEFGWKRTAILDKDLEFQETYGYSALTGLPNQVGGSLDTSNTRAYSSLQAH